MTQPYDELEATSDQGMRVDPDVDLSADQLSEDQLTEDQLAEDQVDLLDDPDLATARDLEHLGDPLVTDELRPEDEVVEFEPPDELTTPTDHQVTLDDVRHGETIEDRLTQEEPDIQP